MPAAPKHNKTLTISSWLVAAKSHSDLRAAQPPELLMERLSPADYLDDPLTAHPRYRKIRDLNEGTFGVVVLAQDVRIKEPVRCLLSTCAETLRAVCPPPPPPPPLCRGQQSEGCQLVVMVLLAAFCAGELCIGALCLLHLARLDPYGATTALLVSVSIAAH